MSPSPRKRPPIATLLRGIYPRTQLLEATLGGFMGLVAAAMFFYPGGTWWDSSAKGHRFWENFLCDLLHRKALNGTSNLVSARLSEIAMLVIVIGIACAFSLSPEVIPSRRALGKRLARVGLGASVLLVLAPLLPSDRFPTLHSMATVFATLPTLGVFAVLTGAILVEPKSPAPLRGASMLLLVLLALCLGLYTWDVYLGGPSLKVLPGLERVATLLLLAWLFLVSRVVRLRLVEALRVAYAKAQQAKEQQSLAKRP